jgi:hypothetical protein
MGVNKIKNRISLIPLTILKMLSNDLVKDLAFSDPMRRLQRTLIDSSSKSASSEREQFYVDKTCIVGLVMTFIVAVACFRLLTHVARRRITAIDASELPEDKTVINSKKSTLSKRRQAILEQLFKTAQVTMVSSDDVDGALQNNKQFRRIQKLTIS